MSKPKYIYHNELHNEIAPDLIVPKLLEILKPESIVDIGCGSGNFLKAFKELGVKKILGIDGQWYQKDLLFSNINTNEFLEHNLENPLVLNKKFDLVICLEVVEHLSKERADGIINEICNLGNIILFSAAVPYQGGINHINEQWSEYWEVKFNRNGYYKLDILKHLFWDSENIWWWYKQNMVLYISERIELITTESLVVNKLNNIIHPELYKSKARMLEFIVTGKASIFYYFKLLIKSLIDKIYRKPIMKECE